jgi:hypothetical protein
MPSYRFVLCFFFPTRPNEPHPPIPNRTRESSSQPAAISGSATNLSMAAVAVSKPPPAAIFLEGLGHKVYGISLRQRHTIQRSQKLFGPVDLRPPATATSSSRCNGTSMLQDSRSQALTGHGRDIAPSAPFDPTNLPFLRPRPPGSYRPYLQRSRVGGFDCAVFATAVSAHVVRYSSSRAWHIGGGSEICQRETATARS